MLALVRPNERAISYVGAGHDVSVVRADGEAVRLDSTSLVLGLVAEASIEAASVPPMQPGDVMLFLTDGVIEAYSPEREPFGWQRAIDIVRSCRHQSACNIIEQLIGAVREFAQIDTLNDDVTAVIVKAT